MLVYVVSLKGKPLMPCSPRKARSLLNAGKAEVKERTPFTIRLLYGSSGYKQKIILGVDSGSKIVGLSAIRICDKADHEEIYSSEARLRNDIVGLIAERKKFRISRRSHKTRYREPRFLNRIRSKKAGWLAPSIRHKCEAHLKLVENVCNILPISSIRIEMASFDIQAIQMPGISGVEYQLGPQEGFWNIREYVLWRDGHRCQGEKGCKNKILNVHHIESRKTGGDSPVNLVTLCKECHDAYHTGKLVLNLKRGASFKDVAFMGIMRWAVYNKLKDLYSDVKMEYGFRTKMQRISAGLQKSHAIDARCITGYPHAFPVPEIYFQRFVRRNNRSLHKATILTGGMRKANKAPREVFGFRLFDKVKYKKMECFIFSRRIRGDFDIRTIDGKVISENISCKKLELINHSSSFLIDRKRA